MMGMNPFLPQYEHIPDGEPRVFGERLYLFGSHDKSHGSEFCSEDYVCWSAPVYDLREWVYEGVIYRKEQDPGNSGGSHCMYAPDVVQGTDGRYYLYYALDTLGQISVAVCDNPAGQYEFYGMVEKIGRGGSREILKEGFPFDPGVLVEEGRVFLYYGFCPKDIDKTVPMLSNDKGSMVCELEQDMITVKNGPETLIPNFINAKGTTFQDHPFFEASSIRKIGKKYYFIYSSTLSHELCYAVSDFPNHDFTYGGTIISNGDIGYAGRTEQLRTAYTGNNHGSIIHVEDQWYVFYHRHTQAIRCCRQACAEKIEILADGTIPQVEITSCGLGKGMPSARGRYNGAVCCNLIAREGAEHIEGADHFRDVYPYVDEEHGEGFVANIKDNTQIGYKYFSFDGTEKNIEITLRGQAEGVLLVLTGGGSDTRLTGSKGTLQCKIPVHIHTQVWTTVSGEVKRNSGMYSLFIVYEGTGTLSLKNFDIC